MRTRALTAESPASWSYACCARAGSVALHTASPHVMGLNVPFAWMTARTGKPSSRHQTTSVMSPKVQIIATPVPFSGSASACARSGTRTPKSGVTTSEPKSG